MSKQVNEPEKEPTPGVVIHLTRYAQIPMLIGLAIAAVLFLSTFFVTIYDSVLTYEFLERKKTILLILNLLDMVFIANLLIMVATDTYHTFLLKRSMLGNDYFPHGEKAYRRMKHRIVSTIVIISSIHVLSAVLEFTQVTPMQVIGLVGFHIVLLATYVVTNVVHSSE